LSRCRADPWFAHELPNKKLGEIFMARISRHSLTLIAALAGIVESAYGQISVTSKYVFDTACGTGALSLGHS